VKSYDGYESDCSQAADNHCRFLRIYNIRSPSKGHPWRQHYLQVFNISLIWNSGVWNLTPDNRVTTTLPGAIGLNSYGFNAAAALIRARFASSMLGIFVWLALTSMEFSYAKSYAL